MDNRIALGMLLGLTGCPAKEGIREAGEDLAGLVGDGIEQLMDEHPTETRALTGLECDSTQECGDDSDFDGHSCRLTATDWRADFQTSFLACLEQCGDFDACYAEAVDEQPPISKQTARERCLQTLATCTMSTDACDAFAIIDNEPLLVQLDACSARPCAALQDCHSAVLLEKLHLPAE